MKTLLRIDSSPMGDSSVSRKLTDRFVESWTMANPDGRVISRDLSKTGLTPIDGSWIGAAYTPETARSDEQKNALATSEQLIGELEVADEYVFGVPMHNFGVPSTLKLWIDQVSRSGKTFAYGADGPKGLLTGKKATLLLASGGVYAPGSATAAMNFVAPYLEAVLGFLGVRDIHVIAAEGTAQLMTGKVDPQTFLAPSLDKVHSHASH